MIGIVGEILVNASFLCCILATIGFFFYSNKDEERYYRWGKRLYGAMGILLVAASGVLLYLILNHRFDYYYVFNYTSTDLQLRYLISAFWGGQEGSFMLWIFFTTLISAGLMKWTRKPYKGPVIFFMALTQVFLFSMISGLSIGHFTLGASPFRTLPEAMPNAPFLQANPGFVPTDGKGLNDLLKSPWMMIHPPILFFGFSMMTVPFCFAMAALWKRKYNDWINPALPWTLGANIALLTAIFLGGYWAYVTLSFGGYWAWDPVENASFVPWLLGTACIHTMLIQKKSSTSQKASIIFALLAFVAVVYETFLTRSGILADSSVHSFVDLGLYNQLIIFMIAVTGIAAGLFIYRYKELPTQTNESKLLSREFMTFAGAMVLFLVGLIIALGTSSPVIGRLFQDNPTPPEVSFYNQWTMPLAIIAAFMTVVGQHLFWKRQNPESLAAELTWPMLGACVLSLATIFISGIRDLYYMLYVLAGWFALIGNSIIMYRLIRKKPRLIGGSLSHVGFGVLLLGILASSAYNINLLDSATKNYNDAIERGEITDEQGVQVRQQVNYLELKLNKPKEVGPYLVTYQGYTLDNQERPGQQQYRIKFAPADGNGEQFYMSPQVYPMMAGMGKGGNIQWSVDPDVRSGMKSDIYLYVAGSSYVERKNNQADNIMQEAASKEVSSDSSATQKITLSRGETVTLGGFEIQFQDYQQVKEGNLPDSTVIAVRAHLDVIHKATGEKKTMHPLFAVYNQKGKSWVYSPPEQLADEGVSISFTQVKPETGEIELTISGIDKKAQDEWVLIVAEEKPFISIVWFGTFLLMAGFSVSILRHWDRERQKNSTEVQR